MDFKGVKHSFPCHDDLLRLVFNRQAPDESCDLLRSLPLGELPESLLAGPNAGVDDLEEQLARAGVEDEDCAVNRFGGEVALVCLVDGDSVYIRVVNEPDNLVGKQLSVVL